MRYVELATSTNFSFLHGASHPRDLVMTALRLGHSGIGIADRNSMAGVVRAYSALLEIKESGNTPLEKMREGSGPGEYALVPHPNDDAAFDPDIICERAKTFKLVVGTRLVFADGTPDIIAYPENRAGWGNLCRLLTLGNRKAQKGDCILHLDDLISHVEGLLLIVVPDRRVDLPNDVLPRLSAAVPDAVWLAATMLRRGDDRRRLISLKQISQTHKLPLIAINDVLYDTPAQRDLQDILTCVREGITIENAGRRLGVNAERHLKAPEEMARLFLDAPEAIKEASRFLDRIEFSLAQLKYEYPDEPVPDDWEPQAWLEELTRQSSLQRYPDGVPAKVQKLIDSELKLIGTLDYARYFLTVHDIVCFARGRGILCQGRGSAANSAVCYVLGITAVDPDEHDVLFARFISAERKEPPDIDVDFEHERREEVIQYIYDKYGRHRAGIAGTVICYRPRSAIRDVGKALGLTEDVTARLANTQWGSWGSDIAGEHIRQAGFDPTNPAIQRAIGLAIRILGFPRHLSQHVGGFVLSRGRLDEIVPIGNAAMADRTFIEWDKDDIDTLGLMKVDVLALGMLTCIRKSFDLLHLHENKRVELADIASGDVPTYDMLCRGDSIGVFQVESRAQINMLPRLKPRVFYDLVIQVAIVRPGPIQGDMVHPYLRRRSGVERVVYPSPAPPHDPDELFKVLNKTCGVPLFQEQAMQLAMVAAQFSAAEANRLRRAMATFRNVGTIHEFETLMVERMVARGYERQFAQRCFEQIKGFGSYGFPESHAASFAKLVYISAWIKCHHPAIFACALLNSQPMGFYAPAQIVRNAIENGVETRAVDVNHSDWDNRLERRADGQLALRLGFRQVDGFHHDWGTRITKMREPRFTEVEALARRTGLPARALRLLADADAFRSLGLDRREALWAIRRLPDDDPLPLFAAAQARELGEDRATSLPVMHLGEHVAADYQTTRLSLKGHPMGLLRSLFAREGVGTCAHTSAQSDGARVRTAGLVLVRQRPGEGNVIFITLEDETGITNVVLWARLFEQFRGEVMGARLLAVEGRLQKSPDGVVHLAADYLEDRSAELNRLSEQPASPDEMVPVNPNQHRHPRDVRLLPKSRDFH